MKQVCTFYHLRKKHYWGLLSLCLLFSFNAWSQSTYTISGTINEYANGEPIIGASVVLKGTSIGTVTDINGKYTLTLIQNPGEYTLQISSISFLRKEETISLGNQTSIELNLSLDADILKLDELVVTGNSVATSRRQLGNAIATLSSEDINNAASTGVDQALAGKISGALVQQNSGDPAGGISIRLRGASTITGSSDPLYIVDGVLVNNSSNALVDIGGNSQNRLVDLNPNDIERIEVIKGAAAAAIYGSRASNGVVQIFTKRGKEGKPKISFTTNFRVNELRKKIDYNEVPLAWENPFDRTDLNTVPVQRFDLQDEIFETSTGIENFLSISGGNDKTKYFVSGSYLNNGGVVKNTNFERLGARLNLDQRVNNWLSLSFGLNYTRSTSQDIPNGGINAAYGAITGYVFSDNSVNPNPDASGVYPATSLLVPRTNPAEAVNRFEFEQKTNRVISNINLVATPIENFSISYRLGIDYYNQSATGFIPVGNTSPNNTGFATRGDVNVFQYNNDLNFSYEADISPSLTSTTVLGGTWQYEQFERIGLSGDRLAPTVRVPTGGTITGQIDSRGAISYWGAFVQESLGFKERLFLTAAVRLDGASTFGADERSQVYLKFSGSYLISEEEFWKNSLGSVINSLKLRASWGQAGNLTALGPFDRLSVYNPIAINGQTGVVPSNLQGNADLAPERQDEIEIGADFGFLKDRIGLELTYYKQNVTDLLLERELSPSTGFSTRFENVGSLENTGFEVLLRANPIRTADFQWNITMTYAANQNEVTRVVGERLTLPGSFATSFVIPGQSLGVFYRQFYAREADGSISLDANGYPFTGTTEEGASSKVIGDPNPDWFGSLINEFSYKNFSLRVQFDAVQGFDIFNWNRRLLDNVIFGGGSNVGEELLGNRPKGFGGAQAGIFEEFVEDGSFVKLRELSLSYTLYPKNEYISSVRFSFVGRNLFSFDSYTGWDPEINTPGQSNGVRGFDFAGVPIPRTYQLGVSISF